MDAPSRSPFWTRLTTRLLLLGLLFYFAVVSIFYSAKSLQGEGNKSAILRWRNQLLEFQEGADIFERHAYPNPPIMAMILLPIVLWPDAVGLPPVAAALGWFWLKVGLTLLALRWVFRITEAPGRPFPLWAKVLTILLSLRAITGDLTHGNINLFILLLIVGFLYAWQRGRDVLAGLVLALSISCKVTPALFVPYLVWKRAWKSLAGCAVGMLLFFWPGFLPALFLGWDANQQQVHSWLNRMVKPFLVEGFVTSEHHNQSLPGLVYRLFTESPSFVTYVKASDGTDVWTPERYHNIVSLPGATAKGLIKLCMGGFVLLVAWTCRTRRSPGGENNPALAAEFAIVVLGMLLFSERTWKHHCVTLLVPFAVLSYHLAVWWDRAAMRLSLMGAILVAVLLMSLTSISLLGRDAGKLAQVYGAYVGAFVVLLAILADVLRRSAAERATRCGGCGEYPSRSLRQAG